MENYTPADSITREDDLHDGIRSSDECKRMLGSVCMEEFSRLLESPPGKVKERTSPQMHRPQMHRVPPHLRLKKKQSKHLYDPVVVSLGPHHHGKPELSQAEEFKYLCLDWCASYSEEQKCSFYNKVLEKIHSIKGCYAEVSLDKKYPDEKLAMMMLLDACYIVSFMEMYTQKGMNNKEHWRNCLGDAASMPFTARDIILLENQIPFMVLKLLISLKHKEEGEGLLNLFLGIISGKGEEITEIPREDKEPCLHLLEACRRVMVEKPHNEANHVSRRRKKKHENAPRYTYHSVTDLKAKGVHFRPSSSQSLKDIRFKSHTINGEIQLPVRTVSEVTKVLVSNMIAYELSPGSKTDLTVLCYTNFMKSLIASPADVKELQDKKILVNSFANDEKVMQVFKEIDTFGVDDIGIFRDVRQSIGEHCSSKAKTWIADLINTQFQSPWTAMALVAATFLLCLTFLQTYFTINPGYGKN